MKKEKKSPGRFWLGALLGAGGFLLLLWCLGQPEQGKASWSLCLLFLISGVCLSYGAVLVLTAVFRTILGEETGELTAGVLAALGGGFLLWRSAPRLTFLIRAADAPRDMLTGLAFLCVCGLLCAALGLFQAIRAVWRRKTAGDDERPHPVKTFGIVAEYWRAHPAERSFLTVWIVVFLVVSLCCLSARKYFIGVFFSLFWIFALFALKDGAEKWKRDRELIAKGTPVWARIVDRWDGKDYGDDSEPAVIVYEYVFPLGASHRYEYKCSSIKLSDELRRADEILVYVDPHSPGTCLPDLSQLHFPEDGPAEK